MTSDNNQQHKPETEHEHEHNSINTLHTSHSQPQNQQNNNIIPSLSIQLPSLIQEFNTNDEPTTPTSSDHKIPVPATCPGAPRKPRLVRVGNKRKTANISRISVDLMAIFDAMFVPAMGVAGTNVLAGDDGAGGRVKKVKKVDVTIG